MRSRRLPRETCGLQPEIGYAKAGELRIAYQIVGEGNPIDLVWAPPMASHLVLDWEWPPSVEVRRRLARFCRLIRFDKRGTGLSDPVPNVATLEERTEDIRAVMDAARSERAVQARWVQTNDYPWGMAREEAERMIRDLAERGPTGEYLFGTERSLEPSFAAFFKRYAQGAASPSANAQLERMNAEIDVRDILPSISARRS